MKNRSFFGTLGGGSSQRENQFSRTFKACFDQSKFLRLQVLEQLFGLCRIRTRRYRDVEWDCAVEVQTPVVGGGRMDIRLSPSDATLPVFYIESKLGSPLTREQLRRYVKHGVTYLIAVTKSAPKYPPKKCEKTVCLHYAGKTFTIACYSLIRRLLGIAS